jgi:hypothetical protein
VTFKGYLELTHEEAARAQSVLLDVLHGRDPLAFVPRLAVADDGAVGLLLKRPQLYDPGRGDLAPSGRPWIEGSEQQPSDGAWLATELAFYPLAEALELLADTQRNPEAEVERRRRAYNARAEVARRAADSAVQLQDEDRTVNHALRARWEELGGEIWERELGGVWKVLFRLEGVFRGRGFADIADDIRAIALDGLKTTSKSQGARYELTSPQSMYLDGPPMPTPLEKWLP